jgi:hypothetical protein
MASKSKLNNLMFRLEALLKSKNISKSTNYNNKKCQDFYLKQ